MDLVNTPVSISVGMMLANKLSALNPDLTDALPSLTNCPPMELKFSSFTIPPCIRDGRLYINKLSGLNPALTDALPNSTNCPPIELKFSSFIVLPKEVRNGLN
ncbi:MAG: hypothetical protein NTZ48_04880, partial [Candidatus Omnitrophica bacterium]|nr:hypothetical protein [Candidatus Omnitrophota bacterium]